MSADLLAFVTARIDEDELWAKAASAGRDPEHGTTPGGVHWTWATGDQWDPVQADPLEPYMGGHGGEWSQPVVLRTVEEWQLNWGGPSNTLPVKIAESEELRTADGAHIARHDPARVLREVALKRRQLEAHRPLPLVDPDGKERPDWPERECRSCGGSWMGTPAWAQGPDFVPPEPEYCDELRHLALVYADHLDYQQEWTP